MHWAFCDIMDKIPVGYNIGNLSLLISIRTSQSLRALHRCRVQEAALPLYSANNRVNHIYTNTD